jgi:hypothetical protein
MISTKRKATENFPQQSKKTRTPLKDVSNLDSSKHSIESENPKQTENELDYQIGVSFSQLPKVKFHETRQDPNNIQIQSLTKVTEYNSETLFEENLQTVNSSLICPETLLDKFPFPPKLICTVSYFRAPIHNIDNLPEEILLLIFKYINYPRQDLLKLRLVSKQWASLLQDKSLLQEEEEEDLEIYLIMLRNERKHHQKIENYLGNNTQTDITRDMRGILVDWLVDVIEEFKMESETLFLAVFYIDCYLSQSKFISKSKLQLLGVTSLYIAAKFDEIYAPQVEDLVYICDRAFTSEEILSMEINILNTLQFDITVCTLRCFIEHLLKVSDEFMKDEVRTTVGNLTNYLSELSLIDYKFTLYRPSVVAASIFCFALHIVGVNIKTMVYFEKDSEEIKLCMKDLYDLYFTAPLLSLKSVPTKYSSISKLTIPPLFA